MPMCAVTWCVAEAATGSAYCAVHRDHPAFVPAPAKETIGGLAAAWAKTAARRVPSSYAVETELGHQLRPSKD